MIRAALFAILMAAFSSISSAEQAREAKWAPIETAPDSDIALEVHILPNSECQITKPLDIRGNELGRSKLDHGEVLVFDKESGEQTRSKTICWIPLLDYYIVFVGDEKTVKMPKEKFTTYSLE